jgi:transposase-like protein
MRPMRYEEVMSHRRNPYHLRRELVQAALREGISVAARSFHTTRKTVRKWVCRLQEQGLAGLRERQPGTPSHPPQDAPDVKVVVVKLRQRMPAFVPRLLGGVALYPEFEGLTALLNSGEACRCQLVHFPSHASPVSCSRKRWAASCLEAGPTTPPQPTPTFSRRGQ